jgi:ubiquinone/menaquinone biosynthesis C-methylase UbiE
MHPGHRPPDPPDHLPDHDVAAAYDRWAATYDADDNRTRDLAGRVLRESSLALGGRQVAELGCGTGLDSLWLAERAAGVVAMDFSAGMLQEAQRRLAEAGDDVARRVRFVDHDIRTPLPLGDESVDAVVIALVLEHVQGVAPVLAECARVLRPGGELLLCEYHPYRQLLGGQARFTPADPHDGAGAEVRIAAFRHTIAEYVNGGVGAGLVVLRVGEWWAEGDQVPRVVSVQFGR